MGCTISQLSLDALASCSEDPQCPLDWHLVFVLPAWLKLWWQEFKPDAEPYLGVVKSDGKTIGLAPLRIKEDTASFIGSVDVCDYLDFVITPGSEREFFGALLDDLKQRGIHKLDLSCLRPDSATLQLIQFVLHMDQLYILPFHHLFLLCNIYIYLQLLTSAKNPFHNPFSVIFSSLYSSFTSKSLKSPTTYTSLALGAQVANCTPFFSFSVLICDPSIL